MASTRESTNAVRAIGLSDRTASNGAGSIVAPDTADKSDSEWFARIIRSMFHAKAGIALHFITGFDERTCHRYAAGHVRPPGFFIRALLRSEQGWPFLAAIMDAAAPKWWLRVQRAMRLLEAIEAVE